jgi:hypothetical protein
MIISILLYVLYGLIYVITSPLRLLSDVVLDTRITSAISTASGYIGGLNVVIPIPTILAIFGIFLVVEAGILVWKGINWLIHKIPTIS